MWKKDTISYGGLAHLIILKNWVVSKDSEITISERYKIFALKGTDYKKNISLSRFIDHRVVAWKFKKYAPRMPEPDIIVASTPPHDLAYEAVMFAKGRSIPIIVDIRDEWPDIFLEHLPIIFHKIARLFLIKDFSMIAYVCRNATNICSMLEDLLEWALIKGNRIRTEYDKVLYLGAKKAKVSNNPIYRLAYIQDLRKSKFIVTFVGTFGKYCNPIILTKAARKLSNENVYFILGGDGIYFEQVKNASKGLNNSPI